MISDEQRATIRRLFFAEHWKVGTIASELGVHRDTVLGAIGADRFRARGGPRKTQLDPFVPFVTQLLEQHRRLCATRVHEMLVLRGHGGCIRQTRELVRRLRPRPRAEAYLRLRTLPGEEAQVDWAHFGHVQIGRAKRALMAFVMVLSWSRALHALFTLDQSMESFLRGHVESFRALGGSARVLLYDNLKSAVLARIGEVIQYHPRLIELASHYHFLPRPVAVARGNEKGRVERTIRFLRDRFFAARTFRDVDDLNAQFIEWRDRFGHARPCPGDDSMTVAMAHEHERPVLLPLPEHPFECSKVLGLSSGKTPYLRFDLNDYSIPHGLVRIPLTLIASHEIIRVIDPTGREVAHHHRSYDRGACIEDERHLAGLVAAKRAAREGRGRDRLRTAVPQAEAFLQEIVRRNQSLGSATQQLLRLLDTHGVSALGTALDAALARGTCAPSAVAHLIEQSRRKSGALPPVPFDLPDHIKARDRRVIPHSLESYDALSRTDHDEQD
jgi:transposase